MADTVFNCSSKSRNAMAEENVLPITIDTIQQDPYSKLAKEQNERSWKKTIWQTLTQNYVKSKMKDRWVKLVIIIVNGTIQENQTLTRRVKINILFSMLGLVTVQTNIITSKLGILFTFSLESIS